jgi:hypothetical protein
MAEIVPEGKKGDVEVKHLVVSEQASLITFLKGQNKTSRRTYIPPGKYAQLLVDGEVMMSDTPAERMESLPCLNAAEGHVFVGGLGLGMLVKALCAKEEVHSVTVYELSTDVIDLVLPYVSDPKLKVVHRDVYEGPEDMTRFDTIFFDIWPTYGTDLLPVIDELKGLYMDNFTGHWMRGWLEEELLATTAIMACLATCGKNGGDLEKALDIVNTMVTSAVEQAQMQRAG